MQVYTRFQDFLLTGLNDYLANRVCVFVAVMTLFMMSVEVRSPLIMESITLPCLKILLKLVKPPPPSSKANKVC